VSEAVHDASDPGCGDGLAAWARDRLRETPTRVVLCTKSRNIGKDHLTKSARIVGGAAGVEEIVNGAKTVAFA
jgi:hypothetical protein